MKTILLILAVLGAIVCAVPSRGQELPPLPPEPSAQDAKAREMQRVGRKAVVTPSRAENAVQAQREALTAAANLKAFHAADKLVAKEYTAKGRKWDLVKLRKGKHLMSPKRAGEVLDDRLRDRPMRPVKHRLAGERGLTNAQSAAHGKTHQGP